VTEHLSDAELRGFVAGTIGPDELLRADDHLCQCDACRVRAAALDRPRDRLDDVRAQLHAPTLHVSDEAASEFVRGRLPADAAEDIARHLKVCATCAGQIGDLRAWASEAAPRRFLWLAIAAAVLLGALIPTALWQLRSRPQLPSSLTGLETLGPSDQSRVRAALDAGVGALPDFMALDDSAPEVRMGAPTSGAAAFEVIAPLGTATIADRPRFEWQALLNADDYEVTVFDQRAGVAVQSGRVVETNWTPPSPLPRGQTFVWQVSAHRGAETLTAPVAPAPVAIFHVIDAESAALLQSVETAYPQSHLLLGILNMQAGIRAAALAHLRQVPSTDPQSLVARRSLDLLEEAPRR
jgi:hypothetical protein